MSRNPCLCPHNLIATQCPACTAEAHDRHLADILARRDPEQATAIRDFADWLDPANPDVRRSELLFTDAELVEAAADAAFGETYEVDVDGLTFAETSQ